MGPVSPHMTIMRTALAKVQALPSSIDERLAAIRKALLTLQRKPRGSSRCLSFSFWVSIVIIFWSVACKAPSSGFPCRLNKLRAAHSASRDFIYFIFLAAVPIGDFICVKSILLIARTWVFDKASPPPKSLGAASEQKDKEQNRNRNSEKPK